VSGRMPARDGPSPAASGASGSGFAFEAQPSKRSFAPASSANRRKNATMGQQDKIDAESSLGRRLASSTI